MIQKEVKIWMFTILIAFCFVFPTWFELGTPRFAQYLDKSLIFLRFSIVLFGGYLNIRKYRYRSIERLYINSALMYAWLSLTNFFSTWSDYYFCNLLDDYFLFAKVSLLCIIIFYGSYGFIKTIISWRQLND